MGWRPLIGFLIGTGLLTLANGMFNLLVGPIVESRGLTEAMIGAIVATGSLSSLVLRIPAGNAFRSGRATALVMAGTVLAAMGYGLLMASAAPALAVLSALQGAGFAVATTAGMAALMERRPAGVGSGSLMGWYTGSIGIGYALAGFVGGTLADGVGPRGALTAAAGAALVSGWVTARSIRRLRRHRGTVDESGAPPLRGWVRGMPTGVWLGFAIAVYINLVNGGMNAFFPLYALGLGLSLSQIGVLSGIHASLASTVRFGAGPLLSRASYRGVTVAMVGLTGLGVTAVAVPRGFIPLMLLVAMVGSARGVLRVVSGAVVMEAAGSSSRLGGRASGIYLAGLDLGNAVGPLIGGVVAEVAGLRGSFLVLGILPALVFVAVGAALSGRRRSGEPTAARVKPEAP
ncbi:MAG: MFS transporter [Actinobacteria bacterium]|nr:MFS transporter [Actinomycetota bacterium]